MKGHLELGVVAHTYNLALCKAEAGQLQVQAQPGQFSKTLTQKNGNKKKT